MDWLFDQATTAPATQPENPAQPTSQPTSPLNNASNQDDSRQATLTLSNNEKIKGRFATTFGKPVRVWSEGDMDYKDIPYNLIKSLEARILWERDQEEWHFIESGSDIKEYTGKTYPARELEYIVTLINGQRVTGGIVAPLYLRTGERDKTFVLHKRAKGDVGKKLKDLVYVKRVEFAEEPSR